MHLNIERNNNLSDTLARYAKSVTSIALASLLTFSVQTNAEELINLLVDSEGVYELNHTDLIDVGLDLSGEQLTAISLVNTGQEVPIEFVNLQAGQSTFSSSTAIRFIGKGIDSLYTDDNVYTLHVDFPSQQTPQRIKPESLAFLNSVPYTTSYLETQSYAPQNAYSFASPNQRDPWYADRVVALRKPASKTVALELEDYVPGGNTGRASPSLTARVWGGTDLPGGANDHHVQFKLNGQLVMSQTFDGFARKEMTAAVSNLRAGTNNVTMELPLDQGFEFEAVNLNEVELSYPRALIAKQDALMFTSRGLKFQIRGFSDPQVDVYRQTQDGRQVHRLTEARASGRCDEATPRCRVRFGGKGVSSTYYAVAKTGLKKPRLAYLPATQDIRTGSAEYLIITHPDFIANAGESDLLAELSSELSSQFSSVDVVNVEQIYAQFGDHIYDPLAIQQYLEYARDHRATKMVLLVGGDVYDYKGFENQDAQSFIPSIYVATDGVINFAPVDAKYVDFNDDNVPELAIGRLPVRTMAELRVLLDKRRAFLNRNYQTKALFAADAFDILRQYSFKLDASNVQRDHFSDWQVTTAFLDDLSVSATRNRIVDTINNGVSLTSFFGHSSTNQWTFEGLFTGADAASLNNVGKPTVVTQWGCWNSYYVNPNEDSMGHRFLMEGDRGAVAVMGATTLTSAANERLLSRYVYEQLDLGLPLGEAVLIAKQQFAEQQPEALDVLLGWTLLGFPELVL